MGNSRNAPSYARSRPAPRNAPGRPPAIADTVEWSRIVDPRERYRILYRDRDGHLTERIIELSKVGTSLGCDYYGVTHAGKFKTLRADRVISVIEQLSTGHSCSIASMPSYAMEMPAFPVTGAVYLVPTVAASNRTWTVDLNRYTCTCPEKRIRKGKGYVPGQLGYVCPHMARAILDHLPANARDWNPSMLKFLGDPRRMHIDNLV